MNRNALTWIIVGSISAVVIAIAIVLFFVLGKGKFKDTCAGNNPDKWYGSCAADKCIKYPEKCNPDFKYNGGKPPAGKSPSGKSPSGQSPR